MSKAVLKPALTLPFIDEFSRRQTDDILFNFAWNSSDISSKLSLKDEISMTILLKKIYIYI